MESSCKIEVKVIYAKDLKAFNFFQKLNVYALVSIVSDDANKKVEQNQQQRTAADKEGDGNPEWNYEMQFDLSEGSFGDCDHLFIQFDLRHEGVMFGDKTIGEVRVPFKDLIQDSNGAVRFVSYQVRTPDGKPNGMLNFCYKVNVKGKEMMIGEITGYPVVHQSPEVQYPSSQEIHYPSLELQDTTHETYFSAPQQVHYLSPRAQYSSQENYYPPPPDAYYPPPPPPFPHPLLPPPPPPMAHGACYRPPRAPWVHPWEWGSYPYGYDMHATRGHAPGHAFD